MSVVQTVVGWGVTAYSLVVSTRGAGDSSASSGPESSDTATQALASEDERGNQDGQVDSLAESLAKVTVGDSKASEDGPEQEITSVNSDPRINHDHTTPEDKSANKEPHDPSTILAETELAPPNVESNLLQTDQVESSLTTASAREHKTTVDPTQQGAGIVQAETEPDDKSASKTSTPELPQEHASHIKSEPADDQSVSIKSIDDDQDIVASKDPKSDGNDEGRLTNEISAQDGKCVSPSTPTPCESRGTPKPAVKVLLRNVDLDSSREAGAPPTSTTSGSQPQEPQWLPANQAIKPEDPQATLKQQRENTTKPIQTECGDADAGQEEPDHLTPKAPTPGLPKAPEQGGGIDSLVGDLDRIKLEDSSDCEDAIQPKQAEEREAQRSPKIITRDPGQVKLEGSVPPTPCDKGDKCRYYFCPWIDWYYVDDSHNAYYEDGTLLHDQLFAIHSDQFAIDQIPYYFYENGLWSQAPDGSFYPIQTRREK
ncbi:unnamed protein product, partial [Rhizoctonia solani]